MKKNLFLIPFIAFAVVSCHSEDEPIKPPARKDIELTRTEQEINKQANVFAFNLFNQVNKTEKEDNFFISPLSASLALSMATNGAAGTTLEEMKTTLGFGEYSLNELNEYYKKLTNGLLTVDTSTKLGIANSIWINEAFDVKKAFTDINKEMYDAEVRNMDFMNPQSVDVINKWCADKTNNRITEILNVLDPASRLCLINALYFKGVWFSKFDKSKTAKEDFTRCDGTKVKVDMMNQENAFNYMETENFKMAELPYGNEAFSMVVMLPSSGKTTSELISQVNVQKWEEWMSQFSRRTINLKLPKFKFEYEKVLSDDLKDMGMTTPFSEVADFSNIAPEVFINMVKQKTFIEVNEEGTEAAAVTVVDLLITEGPDPSAIPDFHVNRPFIYLIKEKSTGAILFMGKIGKL